MTETECGTLTEKHRHGLFAQKPSGKWEQRGFINLHLLLWKFTIYHLVQVETDDQPFSAHHVWQATWKRLERKILTVGEKVRSRILVADSRGYGPPKNLGSKGKPIEPLASISEQGTLKWNDKLIEEIKQLGKPPVTV